VRPGTASPEPSVYEIRRGPPEELLGSGPREKDAPAFRPHVELSGRWELEAPFSDEFNGDSLDTGKCNNDPPDWVSWSWEPENA
jgi:hypothetical protein